MCTAAALPHLARGVDARVVCLDDHVGGGRDVHQRRVHGVALRQPDDHRDVVLDTLLQFVNIRVGIACLPWLQAAGSSCIGVAGVGSPGSCEATSDRPPPHLVVDRHRALRLEQVEHAAVVGVELARGDRERGEHLGVSAEGVVEERSCRGVGVKRRVVKQGRLRQLLRRLPRSPQLVGWVQLLR